MLIDITGKAISPEEEEATTSKGEEWTSIFSCPIFAMKPRAES
ncbi:unnamed protein product [Prunus armeniaca]|uniref:Uncharacterized protein n=1 Tax=Prunus armeniaca TaxID=36596 RepID=A0A6J5UGQ8_PRUAR|nr:unnamed protein product [Prunus armeniaca]